MRIIAGKFRSRVLATPRDADVTRPMPDRVKESLFSLLRGHCEGATVLDAFAGVGTMGLEAISRGAERVVFIERDRTIAQLLRKNIEALGVEDQSEVAQTDALGPGGLARCPEPVDLVFFDPPYPLVLEWQGWERVQRQIERIVPKLSESGFLLLRTPWPFRHIELFDDEGQPLSPSERARYDQFGRRRSGLPPKMPRGIEGRTRLADDEGDEPRERGRDRRRGRGKRAEEPEREWIGDELDLDEIVEETERLKDAESDEEPGIGVKVVRRDVLLAIPGAAGPETHAYASMAVHFYARRPA